MEYRLWLAFSTVKNAVWYATPREDLDDYLKQQLDRMIQLGADVYVSKFKTFYWAGLIWDAFSGAKKRCVKWVGWV